MEPLYLADQFDLAQITLYLFWLFFAALVIYLQREAQREGYPLEESARPGKFSVKSLIFYPAPKTFLLPDGSTKSMPDGVADLRVIPGAPASRVPGMPLEPNNANPLADCIGPGSWAERADRPDAMYNGDPRILPTRVATSYHPDPRDPDPRGMAVVGLDGKQGGVVVDLWVDRAESVLRYLEVEVTTGGKGKRVLLPMNFALVKSSPKRVFVNAIKGEHFADVPTTAKPDLVTLLEEEKICAYYGSGTLYATAQRAEPLL
jgi:photosynthetic reaction center H subunit